MSVDATGSACCCQPRSECPPSPPTWTEGATAALHKETLPPPYASMSLRRYQEPEELSILTSNQLSGSTRYNCGSKGRRDAAVALPSGDEGGGSDEGGEGPAAQPQRTPGQERQPWPTESGEGPAAACGRKRRQEGRSGRSVETETEVEVEVAGGGRGGELAVAIGGEAAGCIGRRRNGLWYLEL
ncbi:hypothetical protein ABZP36_024448 [Zizania latifolia]